MDLTAWFFYWERITEFMTRSPVQFLTLVFTLLTLLIAAIASHRKSLGWYLGACLPPAIWLMSPLLLKGVRLLEDQPWRNIVGILRFEFSSWFWAPLVLWFVIYVIYVWRGVEEKKYPHYGEIIAPRKSVWTVFGIVVLGLTLWVSNLLLDVNQQVYGLRADREILVDGIREVRSFANYLENTAFSPLDFEYFEDVKLEAGRVNNQATQVLSGTLAIQKELEGAQAVQEEGEDEQSPQEGGKAEESAQEEGEAGQPRQEEGVAGQPVQEEEEEEVDPAAQGEGRPTVVERHELEVLEQVELLSRKIIAAVEEIQVEIDGTPVVSSTAELLDRESALTELEARTVEQEKKLKDARAELVERREHLKFLADEINDIAADLEPTMAVLTLDRSIPFSIITVLFAVFLLIPWLLYFSFMISKRSTIVRDTRATLRDLGLLDRLLKASEALGDEQQKVARRAATYLWNAVKQLEKTPRDAVALDVAMAHVDDARTEIEPTKILALNELKERITRIEDIPATDRPTVDESRIQVLLTQARSARDEALEIVIKQRRFYSREYIIPLVILTLLTGVGWYYTYFPNALAGLAQLILDGATLEVFTEYLTKDFTPLTMTFAGAWLFSTVMLITRWAQDDLHPRSYFYSAVRLVVAFLVGLLFANWLGKPSKYTANLMLAFAVGAAPLEFVRAVLRVVGKGVGGIGSEVWKAIVKEFKPPDWGSKHPLTALEDLTIWDDTRLYQEGIQNVHALATADLERLVLNTPFPAQQLVDWVDQALLYIHVKDLWRPGLSAVCIRTATDLLDFCWPKVDSPEPDKDKPDEKRVETVVKAFNHAQGASPGADDARLAAQNAGSELRTATEKLGEKAKTAKETAEKLDKDKPETLDNIIGLRKQVEATEQKATDAVSARTAVKEALAQTQDGEALDDAKKAWQDDSTIATKLDEVKTAFDEAKAATAEDKVTRGKLGDEDEAVKKAAQEALDEAKQKVAELQELAAAAKTEAESAEKKVTEASAGAKVMIAKQKADELKTAVDELLTKAEDAKKSTDGLKAGQDETLQAAKSSVEALRTAATTAKEATEALVKAVIDGGESLESAKSAAEAIQNKLKDGADVQKKISTAKEKVEAAVDAAAITAAQAAVQSALDAVKTLPGSSDSPATSTAAAAVKAINDTAAYKNWNTALEKAKEALTQVTELDTAATEANDIATKLDKDNPDTWDNVKWLKKLLDDLKGAVDSVEEKRSDALKKLGALKEQETYAVAQARRTLEKLEDTRKGATDKVDAAVEAFKELSADKTDGLDEAKTKAADAVKAVETLKSEAESAAEEAIQAALPLQLTEGILEIMLMAMQRDPNIAHVRLFWQQREKRA
jgi:hypothetical protein